MPVPLCVADLTPAIHYNHTLVLKHSNISEEGHLFSQNVFYIYKLTEPSTIIIYITKLSGIFSLRVLHILSALIPGMYGAK